MRGIPSKNKIFNAYIQRTKYIWEVDPDYAVDEIVTFVVEKYNKMSAQNIWDTPTCSSAKIVALTTQIKKLKKRITSHSSNNKAKIDPAKPKTILEVAEWRKTKSFGDSVTKDEKQWHWCSVRHNEGKGMYVTHK